MIPFFITGLPRSRTAWLANLFTWGDSFCHHDALRMGVSVEELKRQFVSTPGQYVGDSDSGLAAVARDVVNEWPHARWVIVLRPKQECLESYQKYFRHHPYPHCPVLTGADAATVFNYMEHWLQRVPAVVPAENLCIVESASLDDERVMRNVWKWLLPTIEFPAARWRMLNTMNVRIISEKIEAPGIENLQHRHD